MLNFKTIPDLEKMFAVKMKNERLLQNITQEDFAIKSGITLTTYKKFENKGKGTFQNLLKIMMAFGKVNEIDKLLEAAEFSPKQSVTQKVIQKHRVRTKSSKKKGVSNERIETTPFDYILNKIEKKELIMTTNITVKLYGHIVGYLAEDKNRNIHFEFEEDFKKLNLEISPLKLNTDNTTIYRNNDDTFFGGLAGVFYDSLPDKFGNALIEQYFSNEGVSRNNLTLLQKLAYVGTNAMGALEYVPSIETEEIKEAIEIRKIVDDARSIINGDAKYVIPELMEAGASAGGARAKAIIAWNKKTNTIKSGRTTLEKDFSHYLFKFDGVGADGKAQDYSKVEYMYMKIAKACGFKVAEVELFNDRSYKHLCVKRFDRNFDKKIHMHSLCGMTHSNFNTPGIFSYEDYLRTVDEVTKSNIEIQNAILHMIFNIISRNQDDHTKNFSFLMDEKGIWTNTPVYDLTYSNGSGYTHEHQLSLNGKRDNFEIEDILKLTRLFDYKDEDIKKIVEFVTTTFHDQVIFYSKELDIKDTKKEKDFK